MQPARQIGPFNYDSLPPQQQVTLKAITVDIAENAQIVVKSVERIGQRLIEAKDMLVEHGQWLNWLSSIEMSHSTATNYMNVASNWAGTGIVEKTDLAPLFILSTSKVGQDVREDFIKLVERGEHLDKEAAKALRDAPDMLRARYVAGTISKEQFVGLAEEYRTAPRSTPKQQQIATLIDQSITDPEAAKKLYEAHTEVIEVAAITGYINFDDRPVQVGKVTKELLELHGWQTKPPKDDEDPGSEDGDSNPPLLKAQGKIVDLDPVTGEVVIVFTVDVDALEVDRTYTFTVR